MTNGFEGRRRGHCDKHGYYIGNACHICIEEAQKRVHESTLAVLGKAFKEELARYFGEKPVAQMSIEEKIGQIEMIEQDKSITGDPIPGHLSLLRLGQIRGRSIEHDEFLVPNFYGLLKEAVRQGR